MCEIEAFALGSSKTAHGVAEKPNAPGNTERKYS
jgi:hypothetical protein